VSVIVVLVLCIIDGFLWLTGVDNIMAFVDERPTGEVGSDKVEVRCPKAIILGYSFTEGVGRLRYDGSVGYAGQAACLKARPSAVSVTVTVMKVAVWTREEGPRPRL
jgi:hypothetical protein